MSFFDNDLLKDLLTGTVGAFLGFLGAYFIFIKGIRTDRKKEEVKTKSEQLDKLKYFTSLIGNVIEVGKTQAEGYKKYSNDIGQHPFKHHLLHYTTNHDLKRATHKLNLEDYYLAYVSQFGSDKESVKKFKKIISSSDYIDAIYDEAIRVLGGKIENLYKKKIDFKKLFEKSLYDAGQTIFIQPLNQDAVLTDFIDKTFVSFYQDREIVEDFDNPKNKFVEPLMDFLFKNDYLHNPLLNQLYFQLKECIIIFNSIQFGAKDISEDFSQFSEQMDEATTDLITASSCLQDTMNKVS